jgi:nucleoside-diphosphate-sugar epimerase
LILLTGSDGFIGKSLVPVLLNQNFDIFSINKNKQKSTSHHFSLTSDITKINNSDLKHSFSKIIHMAALSDIQKCNAFPSMCFDVNVNGTQKILEIARKNDVPIIFFSSSHVYGDPKSLPVSETHQVSPSSIYSSSKIMAETLCQTYSNVYGLDISVVRLFSVFGPNAPSSNLISRIINQISSHGSVKLGNIKPKRDFIFIDDVIDALISIIKFQKNGFNIYNVGTGKSNSVEKICKLIFKNYKKKYSVLSEKSQIRKSDVLEIKADISKMNLDFNWNPQVSLLDGLKFTCDTFV